MVSCSCLGKAHIHSSGTEGFGETGSGIENSRSSLDVTERSSVKSKDDEGFVETESGMDVTELRSVKSVVSKLVFAKASIVSSIGASIVSSVEDKGVVVLIE